MAKTAKNKFIEFIEEHVAEQKRKHPKYSIRVLAAELDVNPGLLSMLLTGKRKVTRNTAHEILEKIGVSAKQIKKILASFSETEEEVVNLTEKQSDLITVEALTVYQILFIRNAEISVSELKQVLKMTPEKVQESIERLEQAGLVNKVGPMLNLRHRHSPFIHKSKAALKENFSHLTSLIQKDIEAIETPADAFAVHFVLPTNHEHILKNVKHYYSAVENMTKSLKDDSGPDIYHGMIYLMKVTK